MSDGVALLVEDNVISLRTAMVLDDGNLVSLRLMPEWLDASVPGTEPEIADWVELDFTWLYRHMRHASEEQELVIGFAPIERGVKPMVFHEPPELKLLWTDSGNSVAFYMNGEPWAFIEEEKHQGYSKGILTPRIGNPWNQELFESTFKPR